MIRDFRVSYRKNPIGLDETPVFSWKLVSEQRNVVQKAYQLQVICQGKMIWDTEQVVSEQSVLIPYGGKALTPRTMYQVQVTVWDNYGEIGQQALQFETGLMGEPWKAKWITHTMLPEETACPVYVKSFQILKKPEKARLYVTACGVYEASLNGRKIGDAFMAPGWTSYYNRTQYQVLDISDLPVGENELSVTVGNGWYRGYLGFDAKPDNYGNRTALLAMLVLKWEDGEEQIIGTDTDWQVQKREIRYSEIYHGEYQDYTKEHEIVGQAVLFDNSSVREICAQGCEPVRVTKIFDNPQKIVTPKKELVFDFGQNMAGIVRIRLPKPEGEKLIISHAETLDREGNFYTENLRSAKCTDTYVYGKEQEGNWVMPHFTFHGFRYIRVEGAEHITEKDVQALVLHTDMEKCGEMHTSHPLVNHLISNINWGQRSNFLDVPTDCPQRDERLGWTGDAQVFAGTASLNYQTYLFFDKWLQDMAAETTEEYGVPHVVPNILGNQAGAAAWSDAATIIPWKMYQVYGDRRILEKNYPMMKTWVEYMHRNTSDNGLWQTGFQYGDWLALDIENGSTDRTGGTDKYLAANCYYALSTRILRDTAKLLGKKEDEEKYEKLLEKTVSAIQTEYVTASGRLVSETQTACVLMLHFDLVKAEHRKRILKTLELNIGAHRNHLTTGFMGTPYLCHCLSENGLHELAGEIFIKEDFPGWFYAVKKGATTIWERWNSILPDGSFDASGMNSLNHYAYGSIGGWLYEKVAGINALEPGYKKIRICPLLTKGITGVQASYESVYGTISVSLTCLNGKITADIRIPANTTAIIQLPEREAEQVGSGEWHYEYATDICLEYDKYSMDSTLGELVAEDLGREMFDQLVPGMLDEPMIKFAYAMTISDLIIQAPEAKPLYQAVIDALNAKAKK